MLDFLCEELEISHEIDKGTVEKKKIFRCQDCKDKQQAEAKLKLRRVL
jgi:hypothetical protein